MSCFPTFDMYEGNTHIMAFDKLPSYTNIELETIGSRVGKLIAEGREL